MKLIKKQWIILVFLAILLLAVILYMKEQSPLHLIQSHYTFEYGEDVSKDINDYLDFEGISQEDKNDILANTQVSSNIQLEDGQTYPPVGNYVLIFQYGAYQKTAFIHVEDTTSLTINCPEYIQMLESEEIDKDVLMSYFTIDDFSSYQFDIDTSQYDSETIGEQTITLKATDDYGNETVMNYQIETVEKPDETFYDTEVTVHTDDSGYVSYVSVDLIEKKFALDITIYCQHDVGARMGCDPAALYMALRYKGYCEDISLKDFILDMPIAEDNDPNHGFAGSPWEKGKAAILETIYPSAIAQWAQKYAPVSDFSGHSVEDIVDELRKGNIVMIYATHYFDPPDWRDWFFGRMYNNIHCLVVSGYDPAGQIRVSDPGAKRSSYWVDLQTFTTSYNYKKFAVLVE